jgi:hypothetical protein
LLTELLKICKTDVAEQCFAGVDACSQDGKIPIMVSGFYPFPVYRNIFEEIFKDGFCVFSIALEELFEKGGVQVFVEDEWGSDFLHICNFFFRYALSSNVIFSIGCAPAKRGLTLSRREKLPIYCSKIHIVMKNFRPLTLLIITIGVIAVSSPAAYAQVNCSLMQVNNAAAATHASNMSYWFGVMELPFLFIAVLFAFLTAHAMKGGKFGKGMTFMAWGFLVMAVGHLHMQIEHYYGINIFKTLLGSISGSIAWFVALVVTWGLSGLGFYSIYKASKGA